MDLRGIIPALITPMKADYNLDEKAFRNYLKWILPQGPVALAVNTDAGEGPLMLPDEKLRLLEVTVAEVGGAIPVICGLGGANTAAMMDFGRKAKKRGADGWLLFPQTSFRGAVGKDPVVLEYHKKAASLGLPIVLFQLQADLGGVELPLATLEALVRIPEVIAIKEATFDAFKYQQTLTFLRGLPKQIQILTGNDNFILESFLMGGDGALIGFGALETKAQVKMVKAVQAGNIPEAMRLYERLNPLAQACFAQPTRDYRARMKEVLRLQGVIPSSRVRPPLLPLSAAEKAGLKKLI